MLPTNRSQMVMVAQGVSRDPLTGPHEGHGSPGL